MRAAKELIEVREELVRRVGNEEELERCRVKHGDGEGPWVGTRAGGVSPLSFAYFSLPPCTDWRHG